MVGAADAGAGKLAVVLFNLGGPDRLDEVERFLFNLFNDSAIIRLPGVLRRPLARALARRRAPVAREIYRRLGGGSPLLANTRAQAAALETRLAGCGPVRCFVAMRYWAPRAEAVAEAVAAFAPDRIVALPLYPQFSTTTTASSWADWRRAAALAGLKAPTTLVCCYPQEPGFIATVAAAARQGLGKAGGTRARPRVLFSAHGLPKRIVAQGDPYQWQVEASAAAAAAAVAADDLDWRVCYQSRVGRLEWLGPETDREIDAAGRARRPVVVVPIAFVSEHSETLVELDMDYRARAARAGVPVYVRVPTVGTAPSYIDGLAALVHRAVAHGPGLCSGAGGRSCPAGHGGCPWAAGAGR